MAAVILFTFCVCSLFHILLQVDLNDQSGENVKNRGIAPTLSPKVDDKLSHLRRLQEVSFPSLPPQFRAITCPSSVADLLHLF